MRSRRCSNQAARHGVPGTTWIRDQPRNPPKYTEKRIRINFPLPCPSRGRAHARRVGSPARRVGSFRGYPFVMIFLAWVIELDGLGFSFIVLNRWPHSDRTETLARFHRYPTGTGKSGNADSPCAPTAPDASR